MAWVINREKAKSVELFNGSEARNDLKNKIQKNKKKGPHHTLVNDKKLSEGWGPSKNIMDPKNRTENW